MTVTLHYLTRSRAIRILWLLEELKVPYETKVYHRDPILAPPSLARVHPSGASPIIEDDGVVYAESGNIIEHLVTKYGQQSPLIWKNDSEKADIKYALYAAESNIFISGLMLAIHRMAVKRTPWFISWLLKYFLNKIDSLYAGPQFHKCLINLQSQIDKNGGYYSNGRLTVADIMYQGTLQQFMNAGMLDDLQTKYPGLYEWNERLKLEPAFKASREQEKKLDATKRSD